MFSAAVHGLLLNLINHPSTTKMEKEMATHSSTSAWKIPWTEEPWWAIVHGVAKNQTRLSNFTSTFTTTKKQHFFFFLIFIFLLVGG